MALSALLKLNVLLGVYNLIPVPPLDGAAVLQGFGTQGIQRAYARMRESQLFQIGGLLAAWWIFPTLFRPLWAMVRTLLYS